MSRAFVREDVEIPERSDRRRSASGLPAGAANYMTADGARHLGERLAALQRAESKDLSAIAELEQTLASATIVETAGRTDSAAFGAWVTLQDAHGRIQKYRVVGVDEVTLDGTHVSWVSELGKALLSAKAGQPLRLPGDDTVWTVAEIA